MQEKNCIFHKHPPCIGSQGGPLGTRPLLFGLQRDSMLMDAGTGCQRTRRSMQPEKTLKLKGISRKERNMGKIINLIGQRFGRLVVISKADSEKNGHTRWNCICDCGGTTTVRSSHLLSGDTRSCGCIGREMLSKMCLKHGMSETTTYDCWAAMKQRCVNPSSHAYRNYGGRGITVCERWMKFENFYVDMGECPIGLTLERKDNNSGYYHENCCWDTPKTQSRNKRSNRIIKYDGKSQCLAAWAEELGIERHTLWYRLEHYPPQFAFNM